MTMVSRTLRVSTRPHCASQSASTYSVTTVSKNGSRRTILAHIAETRFTLSPRASGLPRPGLTRCCNSFNNSTRKCGACRINPVTPIHQGPVTLTSVLVGRCTIRKTPPLPGRHHVVSQLYTNFTYSWEEIYSGRLHPWPATERRSPDNENNPTRRRPRPRHSWTRTSPSARSFGASNTNGSSQNPVRDLQPPFVAASGSTSRDGVQALTQLPQYTMRPGMQFTSQNGQQPPILPGPSGVHGFDTSLPSFPYHYYSPSPSQVEHSQSLFHTNQGSPGDPFRGSTSHARAEQMPPLSPTIGGPEVDMTSTDPSTPRRQAPHR